MFRSFFSRKAVFIGVILAPILLLIAVFIYYPAVDSFLTSLTNRNLRISRPPQFILFNNYATLLSDPQFWQVIVHSVEVVILTLPLEMVVGFAIALLLNERFRGRSLVRTVVLVPWMIPPVVNGFLWGWLLNGDYGALNGLLYQFGLIQEYHSWLQDPQSQLYWVALVQTWTRFSFPTLILLAGLQGIPPDLYEAAVVDGANAWDSLRRITFPLLLPSFAIALIVEFIASFQIFDVIWTLTSGGSAGGAINPFTKTLMIYNYELVFRDLRIGLGAALSYLILLMSMVVGFIFVRRLYNQGIRE